MWSLDTIGLPKPFTVVPNVETDLMLLNFRNKLLHFCNGFGNVYVYIGAIGYLDIPGNICLSKAIEVHFQFSTHKLWYNFKES
jgi:hypothetical protein